MTIVASQRVTRVGDGPGRQQKRYPAGRICAAEGCTTRLSVYNASPVCNCHHGGEPVPKREYGAPPESRATARERQERVLALLRAAEPGEWMMRPGDMMQHEWAYSVDALRTRGYKIDGRNKSNGGGYRFAAATDPPEASEAPQEPSCAATEAIAPEESVFVTGSEHMKRVAERRERVLALLQSALADGDGWVTKPNDMTRGHWDSSIKSLRERRYVIDAHHGLGVRFVSGPETTLENSMPSHPLEPPATPQEGSSAATETVAIPPETDAEVSAIGDLVHALLRLNDDECRRVLEYTTRRFAADDFKVGLDD